MDLFIVITLAVLAVMGIIVGVSNDAVNFLNSAFGSKVAKKNVILGVAGDSFCCSSRRYGRSDDVEWYDGRSA